MCRYYSYQVQYNQDQYNRPRHSPWENEEDACFEDISDAQDHLYQYGESSNPYVDWRILRRDKETGRACVVT